MWLGRENEVARTTPLPGSDDHDKLCRVRTNVPEPDIMFPFVIILIHLFWFRMGERREALPIEIVLEIGTAHAYLIYLDTYFLASVLSQLYFNPPDPPLFCSSKSILKYVFSQVYYLNLPFIISIPLSYLFGQSNVFFKT